MQDVFLFKRCWQTEKMYTYPETGCQGSCVAPQNWHKAPLKSARIKNNIYQMFSKEVQGSVIEYVRSHHLARESEGLTKRNRTL